MYPRPFPAPLPHRLRRLAGVAPPPPDEYSRLSDATRALLREAADELERLRHIIDDYDRQLGKAPTP